MKNFSNNQKGFSYIDVMVAIFILMVGILALVSAITSNLMRTYEAEKRMIAKQVALSTIESIISAKEISRAGVIDGWDSVGNEGTNPVNGVPKGIFLNGFCPIREDAGWDGVAGTKDDACTNSGGCNVPGRPINNSEEMKGYSREIVIEDLNDPERPNTISRRKITVNINYQVNQAIRNLTMSTIVTNY